jgi:hypothetical protein
LASRKYLLLDGLVDPFNTVEEIIRTNLKVIYHLILLRELQESLAGILPQLADMKTPQPMDVPWEHLLYDEILLRKS